MVFPRDSSHFQHWIFSEFQLRQERNEVWQSAIQRISKQLEDKGVSVNESTFLTENECEYLISYFVFQLLFVCSEKHFDYKVTNTAATFLTRFYLKRSVLEYDPRRILITCILLAIKTEDHSMNVTLHQLCDGLITPKKGVRLASVIDSELIVLDAISFNLMVLQPRTAIHYLTSEYYQLYKPSQIDSAASPEDRNRWVSSSKAFAQLISEVNREAEQLALRIFENPEVPFLYTPAQIGIACFMHVSEGRLVDVEKFVSSMFNASDSKAQLFDCLKPKLLDLRTRIVLMPEARQLKASSDDEFFQTASKLIKKCDKLTKLLRGKVEKERRHRKGATGALQTEAATTWAAEQTPTTQQQDQIPPDGVDNALMIDGPESNE